MMLRKSIKIEWCWLDRTGTKTDILTNDVERTLKDAKVSRKADQDDPPYQIEQVDGGQVPEGKSQPRCAD